MERFSERQRIELALIWALALLLLDLLVIAPFLAAECGALRAERSAAEAVLVRVDDYQKTALKDVQTEEKLRVRQARLMEALPEARGQGAFIYAAQRLAQRSGVTIEGVAPEEAERRENLDVQPLVLRFRGSYFDVLAFLHALQEGERAVQFASLSLTAEGDELHGILGIRIAAYECGETEE